jgi:hypothetical protein
LGFESFTAGVAGGVSGAHLGKAAWDHSGWVRLFGFFIGAVANMILYPILNDFYQTSVSPHLAASAHLSVPNGMLACATIGGLIGSLVSIFERRYRLPID